MMKSKVNLECLSIVFVLKVVKVHPYPTVVSRQFQLLFFFHRPCSSLLASVFGDLHSSACFAQYGQTMSTNDVLNSTTVYIPEASLHISQQVCIKQNFVFYVQVSYFLFQFK
jgi:hypothetical protein